MGMSRSRRVRVMHMVYSFHVGGLENVIVQLINRLPVDRYEHLLLSLTDMGEFVSRIQVPDVELVSLYKPPGHAIPLYPRLFAQMRRWQPDVLHTCNLAALEIVPVAWLAGVPSRIHAEHGWDAHDPDGRNIKFQRLRRFYKPFVSHHVAVSNDLDRYLAQAIHVPARRRSLIANGVDTQVFAPAPDTRPVPAGCPFVPGEHWLVGTVGRMQTVKNQPNLARAFVAWVQQDPQASAAARLVLVGDGPLRPEVERILSEAGLSDRAWLPGARSDIATILQALDCFVLPSDAEGTSCTLQEAMSCGLPCIATAVGGTPDLLGQGASGTLVPPNDHAALARALGQHRQDVAAAQALGRAARQQACQHFSVDSMVAQYDQLFQGS
jgi:sugar transferase (PEP-CTERM/EpsH1 system associated)